MTPDPHQTVQELLPWYVNGTLEPQEAALVEAHLQTCEACRAELQTDRAMGALAASASLDVECGWAAMKARIEGEAAPRSINHSQRASPRARRPSPPARLPAQRFNGWLIATNAACLLAIAGVALVWAHPPQAQYHALSAPKADMAGNVVVMFKPTMSEQSLRETLRAARARLVDGPTDTDAYVLHVAAADRAKSLAGLRANGDVVLAQPIDEAGAR